MKLLFDESLSPKWVELLSDLFPESESALRNGLARAGDLKILKYASARNFVLISTDSDFEGLAEPGAERQCRHSPCLQLPDRGCRRSTSAKCDPYRSNAGVEESFNHPRQMTVRGIINPGSD
jgi:hypothetical protein